MQDPVRHCQRLNRSELSVPGNREFMFEKALKSDADIVLFDLEDSVAPSDKKRARKSVIEALNDLDWNSKSVSVRINGMDTPYMYRDVIEIVEQAGDKLDLLMLPKVGLAEDVYAVDKLITQIELACGLDKKIGLELIIESAAGVENAMSIAAASLRTESLHFGSADYAASLGIGKMGIGAVCESYAIITDPKNDGARSTHVADMWHYPMVRIAVAARANNLRPIDGPFGDFSDPVGYEAALRRAAALGFDGKWAIHPCQIALANNVMSPTSEEVEEAKEIQKAMALAESRGDATAQLHGRMIDKASQRQASLILERAASVAARTCHQ